MSTNAVTPLLWFFGVIALIPLLLWVVKRSPMGAAMTAGPVRPVAVLQLSSSQKLVTVEVGQGDARVWLVLGVTQTSISTLHTMAPQSAGPGMPLTAGAHPQNAFAQLLQRMKGRSPDAN